RFSFARYKPLTGRSVVAFTSSNIRLHDDCFSVASCGLLQLLLMLHMDMLYGLQSWADGEMHANGLEAAVLLLGSRLHKMGCNVGCCCCEFVIAASYRYCASSAWAGLTCWKLLLKYNWWAGP
ncbi:hypothetical protein Dimus_022646, partial [Dionaea muscipula]